MQKRQVHGCENQFQELLHAVVVIASAIARTNARQGLGLLFNDFGQAHHIASGNEIDLRPRLDAELFSQFLRDGNLSLRSNQCFHIVRVRMFSKNRNVRVSRRSMSSKRVMWDQRQAARHSSGFSLVDADLVCLLYTLHALLWINDPQALDNLEITVVCLGNVHVHSNVMLTGHHFSWTTRPLSDLCMV